MVYWIFDILIHVCMEISGYMGYMGYIGDIRVYSGM